MSSKFVYSCSMKICASELDRLLESIFCLLMAVEVRSGSWLARGQVNMANEAKLHSSIHSTFEALVVQCALGYCREEELDPFC